MGKAWVNIDQLILFPDDKNDGGNDSGTEGSASAALLDSGSVRRCVARAWAFTWSVLT